MQNYIAINKIAILATPSRATLKGKRLYKPNKKGLIRKLNNPGTSSTDIIMIYSKCRWWSRLSHVLWSLTTKPNALRFPCCAHLEECCEVDLHPTERSKISCKRNENAWAQAAPRKRSCQLGFWWTVLHVLRWDWTLILLHPYSDSEIDSHLLTGQTIPEPIQQFRRVYGGGSACRGIVIPYRSVA